MFKQFLILVAFCLLLVVGAWFNFLYSPLVSDPAGLRYELRAGSSFNSFLRDLRGQGLIRAPFFFRVLARLHGQTQLKAGIYLLPQGTTPSSLLDQVTSGRGLLYHSFRIIPGWTFQQLRTALHQDPDLRHTIDNLSDADVMKRLGETKLAPEGEFYPDTYYFIEGSPDLKLLKRAYKRMQVKAREAWEKRATGLPFMAVYEALIAASLVEKEAHLATERPLIARVLINRLQKKMLLQFDPTVIYGMKNTYAGVIHKQDLLANTPYNTYVHKGLPPTPIALPSLASLIAVLHPAEGPYLYFVAIGGGGHEFSETLHEHHLAILLQRFHLQGFFSFPWIKAYLKQRLMIEGKS